jgi:hypothetical protein
MSDKRPRQRTRRRGVYLRLDADGKRDGGDVVPVPADGGIIRARLVGVGGWRS